MRYISGTPRDQAQMFPPLMDDFVAEENPVRFIDAFVDSLDMEELKFVRSEPKKTGRPGYDPKDLLKLYIYGYLNRIRSSRSLEKETHRNVELMWLMRGLKPDFKTIADFRKNNKKGIAGVFREFTLLCKKNQLFGCELLGIDGSKFKAVNSQARNFNASRLAKVISQIEERIEDYLEKLTKQDEKEAKAQKATKKELREKIRKLTEQKEELKKAETRLKESQDSQASLTDEDARAMRGRHGKTVGYNVQIGVDHKHKLVAAVDVNQARNDKDQLSGISQKSKENLGIEKCEVVADKGYYSHQEMAKCLDEGITPRVPPCRTRQQTSGRFTKEAFVYDKDANTYTCPNGEVLKPLKKKSSDQAKTIYRTKACKGCPLRDQCTTAKSGRQIERSAYEDQIDELEQESKKKGFLQKARKELVEHPFGVLKASFQYGSFLTKGMENVRTEMNLAVLAYNMKRFFNIMGRERLMEAL